MRQLLQQLSVLAGFKHAAIAAQLSSGPVSDRWLLDTDQGRMVLTRDHPLAGALMLDREFQINMLKAISSSGLGPEPIVWDADNRILLLRYIDGVSITAAQLSYHDNLPRVAGLLRQLHALDVRDLPSTTAVRDKLRAYAQLLNTAHADALQREAEVLLNRWSGPDGRAVLCHNDINHGNVIVGDSLRLIDWDYAAPGDAWFDLATVVSYHKLDEDTAGRFLQAYSGQVDGSDYARLKAYCRIYELVTQLWDLCVAARTGPCTGHE